jgi:hypothetical protein
MRMSNLPHCPLFRYRISPASLFKRLSIEPFDSYYNCRLIRWIRPRHPDAPFTLSPRKIYICSVENPKPLGWPQIKWGRTLEKSKATTFQRNFSFKGPSATKELPTSSRQDFWAEKSSGTALFPHKYKYFLGNLRWVQLKLTKNREEKYIYLQSDQPAWKWRSFSRHNHETFLF